MNVVVNGKTKKIGTINRRKVSFNHRNVILLAGMKPQDNPVVTYEAGELTGELVARGHGVRLGVDVVPVFSVSKQAV